MRVGYASCGAIVCGVALLAAIGCSSQTTDTTAADATTADATATAPATLGAVDFEAAAKTGEQVVIQVEADCKVDVEEAHISESKNEEAVWQLNDDPGPLVIQFKEDKGRNALDVRAASATSVAARIKLAKQQGRHPYRIKIGEKECPDPVIIIDG